MSSDLSPEDDAAVARLLAEATEPVTMPAEVSARLDDVLAGLVANRTEPLPTSVAEVLPLQRGRRRWPQVLVAAAAVSVLGYAGSVLLTGQSSSDQATTADMGAAAESAPESLSEGAGVPDAAPPAALDEQADRFLEKSSAKLFALRNGTANAVVACQVPEGADPAATYEQLLQGNRVVVVVSPVSATTSRADVYPCTGGIFPIASTLLLDAR